jgi:hypothetical protein
MPEPKPLQVDFIVLDGFIICYLFGKVGISVWGRGYLKLSFDIV